MYTKFKILNEDFKVVSKDASINDAVAFTKCARSTVYEAARTGHCIKGCYIVRDGSDYDINRVLLKAIDEQIHENNPEGVKTALKKCLKKLKEINDE